MSRIRYAILLCLVSLLCSEDVSAARAIKVKMQEFNHASGKLGGYFALVIGIDEYQDANIPDLATAVNDARSLGQLLEKEYGFATSLLLNEQATRGNIDRELRSLAANSKPDDSILIYYAGHGELDRQYNDGWWIPTDARGGDPLTYLDNSQVQKAMRAMQARHVLLISDSCYSGTLFGVSRSVPPVINERFYLNLYNEKSRWGMTSGNKEPVADQGADGHSIFAYQLLKELRGNPKKYLSTQDLYTRIAPIIANNSEQTPLCRPIRNTGDQGGEFVFIRVAGGNPAEEPKSSRLTVRPSPADARVRVLNITHAYSPGMELTAGRYHVEVSAAGHATETRWVELAAGNDITVDISLTPRYAAVAKSGSVEGVGEGVLPAVEAVPKMQKHAGRLGRPITIKLSHAVAENTPKGQMAEKFKELVARRLKGSVHVEVYPNSQLYSDNRVLEAMLLGDVQMAAPSTAKFKRYSTKYQLFELPFLFKDMDGVDRFERSTAGRALLGEMKNKGLLGLGYLHYGMKQLSATRPLREPHDCRGLKFRIMSSDTLVAQFNAVNAEPLKFAFAEVFTGLLTGVIDGQENTWANIYSKRFYEVQPYITESNHGLMEYLVVTSVEFWNALPSDIQKELQRALDEAVEYGNRLAAAEAAKARQIIIASKKSEIIQLSAHQRSQWVEAMKPVWKKFEREIGKNYIDAAYRSN